MKVNDYVKYENEVVKIVEIRQYFSEDSFDDYVLSNGVDTIACHLKPLTQEETLEYFKGRFEELGYELTLYNDETIRVFKQLTDNEWDEYHKDCKECNYLDLKKSATWEFANYHIELYKESWYITSRFADDKKIPNSFIDLIREFQNWYWRDK